MFFLNDDDVKRVPRHVTVSLVRLFVRFMTPARHSHLPTHSYLQVKRYFNILCHCFCLLFWALLTELQEAKLSLG